MPLQKMSSLDHRVLSLVLAGRVVKESLDVGFGTNCVHISNVTALNRDGQGLEPAPESHALGPSHKRYIIWS